MGTRILLVEDDPGLRLTLAHRLGSEGYSVETSEDGQEGLARASREPFDLVILDLMLPRKSGFDVCRELRQQGIGTPILMLTARGQLADRVVGLKLGADDYVAKPFEMAELLARVEARVRERPAGGPQGYAFGDIRVDFRRAEVWRGSEMLELSAKQFRLLCYFIEHRGATIGREELLNGVWGYDAMPSTRTVDVHVAWLRRLIEQVPHRPQYLLTVHRVGYKFVG
jgi:two-component system, OmpR family, alkaline phosphatase synthesis response regulator PhoP